MQLRRRAMTALLFSAIMGPAGADSMPANKAVGFYASLTGKYVQPWEPHVSETF